MKRSDAPAKQPVPFGVNGTRESLLATAQPSSARASYDAGFPPITMTAKASGGLPPKGPDFNQILYELSDLGRWGSAGALQKFDSAFSAAISGYPEGSLLMSDDSSVIYLSTVDDNTANPNSDLTGWVNLGVILGADTTLRSDLASSDASEGAAIVAILESNLYQETPFVSPEMYGAPVGSSSSADTQALIDAFAAAKAMGVSVKLSRFYNCSASINVTSFYSQVFGLSMATCGIVFSDACGLSIDNSATTVVRKAVELKNFSIKATSQQSSAPALTFTGTGGIAYAKQLVVRDFDVSNSPGTQSSFATVFMLIRAGQSVFDNVNVTGGGTSLPSYRMSRIFDTNSTKNINILNGSFQNFDTFMYAHDDTEGVVVFGNHIIAGRRGVVSENNVGNLFQVTNNHFNTSLSAIELGDLSVNGGNHSIITDNFCIVWNGIPEDATTPYVGFKSCSNYCTFNSNEVLLTDFTKDVTHTLLTSSTDGTKFAENNTVANPRANNCTRGVSMTLGTQSNNVYNVQRINMTLANAIIDAGTNNKSWIFDVESNTFMTRNIKLCNPGVAATQQIRMHSTTDSSIPSVIIRATGGTAGVGNDGTLECTAATTVVKSLRPSTSNTFALGNSAFLWSSSYVTKRYWTSTLFDAYGSGSPEGVLTGAAGSTYRRSDGGANTSFYVKESGTGNTGWVAK